MAAISKNVYIDKIGDIVKEYNNKYHTSIKMKPVDVTDNTYIDFKEEVNNKAPKFKVGDYKRISKNKIIFAKGYTPNWSEEIFVITELKIQHYRRMLLMILMVKKLSVHFMKKNCNIQARMNLE